MNTKLTIQRLFTNKPLLIILLAICCYSCKKNSETTAKPGSNEVWMQNTSFNPASITIARNTTVTWTNKDGMTHTVTDNTGLFDSGNIGSNSTFSHAFTSAGTFAYHCKIHSGMTGSVTVQ